MTAADPTGRVAFITGGASGIGLAVAELLQRRGMKLVLIDGPDGAGAAGRRGEAERR